MIKCAVFRGSKAAGRLTAARGYSTTFSSETNNSLDIEYSSIDHVPTNSSPSATIPARDTSSFEVIQTIHDVKDRHEAAAPTQFPYFKRIKLSGPHRPFRLLKPPPKIPPKRTPRQHMPFVQPAHLPMSPLMDPSFTSARSKHKLPKARPVAANLAAFQMQLKKNPYALALATPVRMCNITRVALPNFFLQDYNLLAEPQTGEVWWMPGRLVRKRDERKNEEDCCSFSEKSIDEETIGQETNNGKERLLEGLVKKVEERKDEEGDRAFSEKSAEKETRGLRPDDGEGILEEQNLSNGSRGSVMAGEHAEQDLNDEKVTAGESTPKSINRLLGPTVYTLARKEFLYMLSNKKKTGYSSDFQKHFIDTQLLKNPASRQLFSKAHWRADIDEFILERMRRRIVEGLAALLRAKVGYIVGCKSWEDALTKPQTGVYLWMGTDESEYPPEFATLDRGVVKKCKVPTHNLKVLLGREKLEKLRIEFGNGIFDNNVLAVRHRRRTLDVQLRLWRLQGYLAEYRDIPGLEVE